MKNKIDNKEQLIIKLEEYIDLLNEEFKSCCIMAWVHGWRSKPERIERGERLRKEIEELKNER